MSAPETISDEAYIAAAREGYGEDVDFDDVPAVSRSEEGAYVQCWVWVSADDARGEAQ